MLPAMSRFAGRSASRLALLLAAATIAFAPSQPQAQRYPSRTVTIVVPLAAGTGMDTIARSYGEKLASTLSQPVIVENKPGGAFILATQSVIAAPADGHTLLVAAPVTLSINQTLFKRLPYDPQKDLVPLSLYAMTPFILVVNPSLPVTSVAEFVQYAQKSSSPLSYSSPAGGGVPHYMAELFRRRFGLQLTHVPYSNSPQSIQDIAAGHINFAFAEAGVSRPLIQAGKLRALAVSSKQRLPALPALPTLTEATGMTDFEIVAWHALVARAGTPESVISRLNAEMKRIISASDMQQRISDLGLIPIDPPTTVETERYVRSETVRWKEILQTIGLAGSQ
jgi:tripartite-type tricarboxylate transporter receptor subunit TctC